MTINEFINKTKEEPLNWINYCEILIKPSGGVLLARPSHTEALIHCIMNKYEKTREDVMLEIPFDCSPLDWIIDKCRFVAVWYEGYICHHGGLNRFQKRSIKILEDNNLIAPKGMQYNALTHEYENYLYRKSLGIYDN